MAWHLRLKNQNEYSLWQKSVNINKIETPRLTIRPVRGGDQFAISEAIQASLEDLQRWMPWAKDPSFETTEAFVQRANAAWSSRNSEDFPMVVVHRKDQKIIVRSCKLFFIPQDN